MRVQTPEGGLPVSAFGHAPEVAPGPRGRRGTVAVRVRAPLGSTTGGVHDGGGPRPEGRGRVVATRAGRRDVHEGEEVAERSGPPRRRVGSRDGPPGEATPSTSGGNADGPL